MGAGVWAALAVAAIFGWTVPTTQTQLLASSTLVDHVVGLPRGGLLRLRGAGATADREPKDAGAGSSESAGVQAGLTVSAQCAAHAAPPQKHELTRKMEAVWRLADTLRRRRTQPVHAAPSPREDRADAKDEDDGGTCHDMLQELMLLLEDRSALLRHEVCYAMGQTGMVKAAPVLVAILQNTSEHGMVRHEAAEGLAALCVGGRNSALEEQVVGVLKSMLQDRCQEVADTCQVATDRLCWQQQQKQHGSGSAVEQEVGQYVSVDPAPAWEEEGVTRVTDTCEEEEGVTRVTDTSEGTELTSVGSGVDMERRARGMTRVDMLRGTLLDSSLSLFQRYRAMFQLRNIGGAAAVAALSEALEEPSALLRHETAFVLGQLGDDSAREALSAVLANCQENCMVRHEAAEALGALGDVASRETIARFVGDSDPVVAESCVLALDMLEYWGAYKNPPA